MGRHWSSSCHTAPGTGASPVIIGSGDPSWGFGALTKIGEVSRPLIVRGTGHGLCSGIRCIFKGVFFKSNCFFWQRRSRPTFCLWWPYCRRSETCPVAWFNAKLSPKPSNMGLLMNYQLYFNVKCPPGSPQCTSADGRALYSGN